MDLGFVVSIPSKIGMSACKAMVCLIMFLMGEMVLPLRPTKGPFTIHYKTYPYRYNVLSFDHHEPDFYTSLGYTDCIVS